MEIKIALNRLKMNAHHAVADLMTYEDGGHTVY